RPAQAGKLPSAGHAAIRALSFAEVDRLREQFEPLNPWRDTLKTPFLKLEKENFDSDGMPHTEKLNDLHGRPMVNVVSGTTFYIHDKSSSSSPKSPGWLSLKTMEDEINHLLSRTESKFCNPNGSRCTSNTIGLLVRRHIVAGEFHYVGKEASTRGAGVLISQ